jgi:hypothetical protein
LKDGTVRILAGELTGVALTSEPAIKSARVESVAATEDEISDSTTETEAPNQTEGEDEVEDTVKDAATAETVEAAQSITATAHAVGGFKSTPRIEVTAAKYLENKVLAATGDENARQYVLAADNTTDNAGLVPTRQLTEVINGLSTTIRPSIDAISRGALPDAGMTFEIPKITLRPTVAVEAEDAAFSETDQNSAFLSVDVKKFAGQQKFSVELLTRTSPLFYDEVLRNMVAAMAKAQDAYVNAQLVAGATADATTIATYPTAAELLGVIARGSASVYGATAGLANPFARNILVNTSQWSNQCRSMIQVVRSTTKSQTFMNARDLQHLVRFADALQVLIFTLLQTPRQQQTQTIQSLSSTLTHIHGTKARHTSCAQNQPLTVQSQWASIHSVHVATKIAAGAFGVNKT